eukprot:COSAG01_NODE_11495_length_1922_cov_1.701591_3_plen_230_part_00
MTGCCGSVACPDGMRSWLHTQINDQQLGLGEVSCMGMGCSHKLTLAEIERFHPLLAARADQLALEKALAGMADWVWCAAGCGAGGFQRSGGGGSGGGGGRAAPCCDRAGAGGVLICRTYECPHCAATMCTQCLLPAAHHETPAGVWRSCGAARVEADQASASEAHLWAVAKRCPAEHGGCGSLTQRDGGCSHMTCRVCRFQWCWLCAGKYQGKYTMGNRCPCPQAKGGG